MTLGDLIYQYRVDHHISQRAFAQRCNVSNVYISMLEKNNNPSTGKPIIPSITQLKAIASAMGYTLDEIMRMVDDDSLVSLEGDITRVSNMSPKMVPLLGEVAAGEPIFADQQYGIYVNSPANADFALTIKGESMNPTYLEGDVVYIKQQPDIDYDGQIAVVLLDDSATVKHVYKQENGLLLVSDNPAWKPMFKPFSEYNTVRILGKVCGYTRMYKE